MIISDLKATIPPILAKFCDFGFFQVPDLCAIDTLQGVQDHMSGIGAHRSGT